jgi:hypothetical protein
LLDAMAERCESLHCLADTDGDLRVERVGVQAFDVEDAQTASVIPGPLVIPAKAGIQGIRRLAVQSGVCRGLGALLLAATTACSGQQEAAPVATAVATPSAADAAIPETVSPYDALPEAVRLVMDKPFTGDFDSLVARRAIRVGETFNRTHYFIDQGQERGLTYESLKLFENDLNADLKTGNLKCTS